MVSEKQIPVVVYRAKSTEDRKGSLGTQDEDCLGYADREGWEVVGNFYDEGFSAYKGNRGPGLAAAKALAIQTAAERERCILLAQDSDRFARGAGDKPGAADHLAELFFAMGRQRVELWTVRSGKIDKIRALLEGERSNDETERKAQAVSAGIKREKDKGKPFGGVGLGWMAEDYIVDGKALHRRVINPDTRPIVDDLFAELDKDIPPAEVARRLNRQGYRTGKRTKKNPQGREFTARAVRAIAANPDYMGTGPYPKIIEPELWERVNEKLRRADEAAVRHSSGGGRDTLADYMLRKLAFCAECGEPINCITRRRGRNGSMGLKRTYKCGSSAGNRGTCKGCTIPAEMAEQRILEHLESFVGQLEPWIAERVAERSQEHQARQSALDAEKARLVVLDRQREKLFVQYQALVDAEDPLARLALEPIAKLDESRERQAERISDEESRLSEWSEEVNADGILDFYETMVESVQGRINEASSIREVNAALHDRLLGVWLGFDGQWLTVDVSFRPTGDDYWDECLTEMFSSLEPRREALDVQRDAMLRFPDPENTSRASPRRPPNACATIATPSWPRPTRTATCTW